MTAHDNSKGSVWMPAARRRNAFVSVRLGDFWQGGLKVAHTGVRTYLAGIAACARKGCVRCRISMGHLQGSLSCANQAMSTGSQQLLSKTANAVSGGAGRSGFLPPHLHDTLGTSVPTDPRFSSTCALDTPFRPVCQPSKRADSLVWRL